MPPTPFMGLVLPTVGITLGPLWATEVNSAFNVIDAHNHTPGNGTLVPSSGLNINQDLSFNSVNAIGLRSTRFVTQASPLSGVADLTCLYVSGNNLYYNNGVGNQVQITQGAGLDASTVGGFGGDYGTSTASAFYTSATSTFTFWSAPNVSAFMDQGATTIHPTNSSTLGVTVSVPTSLGSNYNVVLPGAAPTDNNSVMSFDTSGNGAFVANSLMPVGTIISSMSVSTPAGYLYCDGSAVSRTTYAALFAVMGTSVGAGDGSTTFNIPALRGVFLRGQDDGAGIDPDASSRTMEFGGGNTGDNVGTIQPSAYESHTHTVNDPGHTHSGRANTVSPTTTGFTLGTNSNGNTLALPLNAAATGITLQNSGGSTETRPYNFYVRYYIKF